MDVRAGDGLEDATSVVVIVSEVVTVVRDCANDKVGSTASARPKRGKVNIADGSIIQCRRYTPDLGSMRLRDRRNARS